MLATELDKAQQETLLRVARESVEAGLGLRKTVRLPAPLHHTLAEAGASFVTLSKQGSLRGCIGTLEAHQALIEDVMHNALAAALSDPRFEPLGQQELATTCISISILQEPHTLYTSGPGDLYEQLAELKPGLIVEQWQNGRLQHKATFLPSVWEQLPEPESFVRELKRKAGIEADFWSSSLRWLAYNTQQFDEQSLSTASSVTSAHRHH